MTNAPAIWISAGETSGDLHGQLLVRALREQRPDASFMGMAGPAMRDEGVEPLLRTESLSVMGFTEVLAQLPRIIGLLRSVRAELAKVRPDVVVVMNAVYRDEIAAALAGLGLNPRLLTLED